METLLVGTALIVLGILVVICGSIALQGLKKVPAQPPHVAIRTILGSRTQDVVKEGWAFFPLYPWWHGAILVNITKVNQDLPEQKVRTPDRAELAIPVSITWVPAKDDGKQLIVFLDSGGEKGVKTILEDLVRERLREWAISTEEGPADWVDAMGAREEAVAVLLKAIIGDEGLEKIPSGIPTPILLRYFAGPQRFPTNERDKTRWGAKWEILEKELPGDLEKNRVTKEKLKAAVDERRNSVQRIRQGDGKFNKIGLGIYINRLNIGEIKPLGKLAEFAELEAREAQERRGEVFEVDTDLLKAGRLLEVAEANKEKLSIQDAYRIVMEWKTTREGRGFTIPGLSPALAEAVSAFFQKERIGPTRRRKEKSYGGRRK